MALHDYEAADAERAKKEAESEEAARRWKASMAENRLRAARRQASELKKGLVAGKVKEAAEQLKAVSAKASASASGDEAQSPENHQSQLLAPR